MRRRLLRAHCALTFGPGCGIAAFAVRRVRRTLGRPFYVRELAQVREAIEPP